MLGTLLDYLYVSFENRTGEIPKEIQHIKIDDGNYNYDFPLHLKPKIYYVSDVHLKHACKKIISKTY